MRDIWGRMLLGTGPQYTIPLSKFRKDLPVHQEQHPSATQGTPAALRRAARCAKSRALSKRQGGDKEDDCKEVGRRVPGYCPSYFSVRAEDPEARLDLKQKEVGRIAAKCGDKHGRLDVSMLCTDTAVPRAPGRSCGLNEEDKKQMQVRLRWSTCPHFGLQEARTHGSHIH